MHRYRVGYTRTPAGAPDRPGKDLSSAGCHEIVSETVGVRQERPRLLALLDRLTAGDILVVLRPSHLAADAHALLALLAAELAPRGIALEILSGVSAGVHEPRGTRAEMGLFATAALAAELEHDLRSERTHEGLAVARAHGRLGGRPRALTDDQLADARARHAGGQPIPAIALALGVGRSTLYRALETAPPLDQDDAPAPSPQLADDGSEITPAEDQPEAEERQAADRPTGRLRNESRLGPDWATDEDDVLWWRRGTRAGSVAPAWPGPGWTARTAQHTPIATGAGKRGAYPSRIKALAAVAADFEARRRARTVHADVALDGAPGWRLRQTQADHDRHRWNVVTPTSDVAGTVTKAGWHHQAWEATAGDPAKRHHDPIPIEPIGDEPGRSSADGYWRTRTAAALAVARWHDPDLDTGPGRTSVSRH
ncbi:DNA invertase Pin-like site-specific DNA recombinase [Nonomuraea thailandensis]|uniref:DNA invertase Pin-like site-specific DNA recombinase n=1 Tax=Nonomuraea thailandensis TaxID=1188745 RepID=A0A9X2KA37_9ACTN|nr:recombinase family protein [Nonomuraea thailandensis]MCP2365753.1 DNA invertase Pin-like site-specific DNA recombinase [Nonomuraea thailandensis]